MSANKNAGKHPSYNGYSISSIARKRAYDKKYHQTPERKRYRARLNKENRERGTYGNGDGKDMSHTKSGKLKLELARINRARNGRNGKSTKS
jgi:hypothetical protein